MVVAEVDRLVPTPVIIHGASNAGDDVINVRVIAAAIAASKQRDPFATQHQLGELPDGEVGTLTWPVDGEKAKREEANPKKVAVGMAEELATDFRAGVGADRAHDAFVLAPRHGGVYPVYTAGRCEDELADLACAAELEHVLRAPDVHVLIQAGLLDRLSDTGAGRDMNDHVIAVGQP